MELFPAIPLEAWAGTKETLHRFLQIVGKIRLASSPQRNHWWNVAYHLTGEGITARPMGRVDGNPAFTIDFDFVAHRLLVRTLDGGRVVFPLYGQSVASFYRLTLRALASLGVEIRVQQPWPYDLPDSDRPFADDTEHATYDPEWVYRYWQVLSQVALVLEEFAGRFSGKVSPVHHFWHTFDLAHTRFAERRVDQPAEVSSVVREAYSREVISFGFWFGDATIPEPAFYAYTAPEPPGLAGEPLRPAAARWIPGGTGHLALLRYEDARATADLRGAALDFYENAYLAGARRAGWDIDAFSCPGGVTDPQRAATRPGVRD